MVAATRGRRNRRWRSLGGFMVFVWVGDEIVTLFFCCPRAFFGQQRVGRRFFKKAG
jgi:hypothetical protein